MVSGRAAMGLTYIAVVAFVVVLFLELLVLVVFILVEVVVGVPRAADAAVGLEQAHVRLERERDAASAGAEGGRGSGGATGRGGRGREPNGGEAQWRRPRQLELQRHRRGRGGGRRTARPWIFVLDFYLRRWGWGIGLGLDEDEGESLLADDVERCGHRAVESGAAPRRRGSGKGEGFKATGPGQKLGTHVVCGPCGFFLVFFLPRPQAFVGCAIGAADSIHHDVRP